MSSVELVYQDHTDVRVETPVASIVSKIIKNKKRLFR